MFVPLSTCCSCKATWIRFRGVDIDRAYLRWTTIGKRTSWEMCVTLGRSSFGKSSLLFNLLLWSHERSSDEFWTGVEIWKSPFSDLNPMAGMRLSMTLASNPQPAADGCWDCLSGCRAAVDPRLLRCGSICCRASSL